MTRTAAGDTTEYETRYHVTPHPSGGFVDVTLDLRQPSDLLREVRFKVDDPRFSDFEGSGQVLRDGNELRWLPPGHGGSLRWRAGVANRRNDNGYDAWLEERWGLFRAEDIIPRAATRTMQGARSTTRLVFDLPSGWSVVTQYPATEDGFTVERGERRFKQPDGWIVMGKLGVRRERIAGMQIAVAGPEDNGVRRLDMLALLNWTLPELARIVPELPARLTIVSAGEPMWRGGLSAPASIYIHPQRPLISENGTSTLLHEIMHVVLDIDAAQGYDWIVEGLAEYYSIELLRRSGTISESRFERARLAQKDWSLSSTRLCSARSTGATTARAVAVFIALDEELRKKTRGKYDLDDVVPELLAAEDAADHRLLREIAIGLVGENPDSLHIDRLPGCRKIAVTDQEP